MNTARLMLDAFENGGGTYQLVGSSPYGYEWVPVAKDWGYFVSRPNGVENFPESAMTVETLDKIVTQRHLASGFYLGLWRDDNGNWSIDETQWLTTQPFAVFEGIRNHQRAIWDCERQQEISLELTSV